MSDLELQNKVNDFLSSSEYDNDACDREIIARRY